MPESGQSRPRILLITRNLPPLRGGMERLNQRMVMALASFADVVIIGPAGCSRHLPSSVSTHETEVAPLSRFLARSMALAWKLAAGRFDFVIAGSGLTAPAAVVAAWRAGAKSIAYVHGLDLVARHLVYRSVWLPTMRRLDAAFANSANTADLAMRAGVAGGNVRILHPGTDIPATHDKAGACQFRARLAIDDAPILLSVGRLTERKGLAEFVAQALPLIVSRYPEIRLVLVGDEAPDALRRSGTGPATALLRAASDQGLSDRILRLGPCDEKSLRQAYAAANVHVFPVRRVPGDVEGFGMVAIEAAANGLPTVAFSVGGVPDAVRDGESGWLVPPGDYAAFAGKVCAVLEASERSDLRGRARKFAADFSWPLFGERLHAGLRAVALGAPPRVDGHRGHGNQNRSDA